MGLIKPIAYWQQPIIIGGITPPPPPLDPDAAAFLTVTGITDTTITNAINNLVISLKADSLWTKLIFAYPFVGGTANTNKYNLKNPVDSNAAFRLGYVVNSGAVMTHSLSGFEVKNSTFGSLKGAYGITYCIPSAAGTLGSEHLSIYVNSNYTQLSSDPVPIGAYAAAASISLLVNRSPPAGNKFLAILNSGAKEGAVSATQAGFFVATRNSTTMNLYRNGGTAEFSGTTTGTLPNSNIYIGALNINNDDYGSVWSRFAWSSYGLGLTATDSVNLYNAVQACQVALSRQA